MKTLGIDTSTSFLSVVVLDGDRVIAGFHQRRHMQHSSLLLPAMDAVLKKRGLRLKDIGLLALSIGPGSFTGLRIGASCAKAINMATNIPIVTVPTLDIIAYNFVNEKKYVLCPFMDAKKEKIYASFYKNHAYGLTRILDYLLCDVDSLLERITEPTLFFGDAVARYGEYCRKKNGLVRFSNGNWQPKAEIAGKLGILKFTEQGSEDPDSIHPIYLHSKYCQVKRGHK